MSNLNVGMNYLSLHFLLELSLRLFSRCFPPVCQGDQGLLLSEASSRVLVKEFPYVLVTKLLEGAESYF